MNTNNTTCRMRVGFLLPIALAIGTIVADAANQVFYYNDVTGESKWDEPDGLTTYTDNDGRSFWVDKDTGESTYTSPTKWSSHLSDEHDGRMFYYNSETQEATWDKPEELGWRRVEQEASVDARAEDEEPVE